MDKTLLSHQTIGPIARGAGTTSNVLYFKAKSLWVACSGDSRAVMGTIKGGKCVAVDLSMDHKPDLPLERKRIEAAGGVVSAAGPRGLPPSRVWVNGRVGLAMSRSLGDGEAKLHGVIPDPEIKEFTLNPAEGKGDGDKFVIAASDGIWEFISSQQACDVVMRHSNATDACAELVNIAETKWREEEGSYRDDITCAGQHALAARARKWRARHAHPSLALATLMPLRTRLRPPTAACRPLPETASTALPSSRYPFCTSRHCRRGLPAGVLLRTCRSSRSTPMTTTRMSPSSPTCRTSRLIWPTARCPARRPSPGARTLTRIARGTRTRMRARNSSSVVCPSRSRSTTMMTTMRMPHSRWRCRRPRTSRRR